MKLPTNRRGASLAAFTVAISMGVAMAQATAAPAASAQTVDEQRIDDSTQTALAVTIYNDDLALVKDRRRVSLAEGENRLAWRSVSQQIQPETALLAAVSGGLSITTLEQNFDFDLLTPESLLKKYVGRTVQVIRTNDAGERTSEEATVLAASSGTVLRYGDRIETAVVGHLAFPDVPENLRDKPTLVLHLLAAAPGDGELELSYLTDGIEWKADYVADLHGDGAAMDLNGWVTLTNQSGVAYRQAAVQLVAGEVNRVQAPRGPVPEMRMMAMAAPAPMPSEEALDEYHLYTLPRPTDILNQQTKQVALLSAPDVPIERELVVFGQPYSYRAQGPDAWVDMPVQSRLKFDNRDGSLGIPLPAGVVRVYSKDSKGNAQFVGEDEIDHTPKHETVSLKLGESFDVTAKRKQTSFRKLSGASAYDYAFEAGFEMELKNAKPAPVAVRVVEQIPADWRMVSESLPHTKESATNAAWTVEIPAEDSVTLTWLVQVRR